MKKPTEDDEQDVRALNGVACSSAGISKSEEVVAMQVGSVVVSACCHDPPAVPARASRPPVVCDNDTETKDEDEKEARELNGGPKPQKKIDRTEPEVAVQQPVVDSRVSHRTCTCVTLQAGCSPSFPFTEQSFHGGSTVGREHS